MFVNDVDFHIAFTPTSIETIHLEGWEQLLSL